MDPRSKHNSAMHQFLVSGRGAVAVEFAFVLPIILLIIWAFWQMSESYRLQWTLNRQTASLADMLINQPEQLNFGGGTECVTLPLEQQFPVLIASANEMLKNAISKDAAGIRTGLTVEYATGKITNDGVPVIYTFANGARCGGIPGTLPLVSLLGDGGGALTPPSRSSNAGIRVLRVQSCMQRKEAPAYLTLVAPKEFQSRYTTLRKED